MTLPIATHAQRPMNRRWTDQCGKTRLTVCYAALAAAMAGMALLDALAMFRVCALLNELTGRPVAGLLFGITLGPLSMATVAFVPLWGLRQCRTDDNFFARIVPGEFFDAIAAPPALRTTA